MGEEKKAKNEWVHFRELRARCPVCALRPLKLAASPERLERLAFTPAESGSRSTSRGFVIRPSTFPFDRAHLIWTKSTKTEPTLDLPIFSSASSLSNG